MQHTAGVDVASSDVAKRINVVRLRNGGSRKGDIKAEALPVGADKPVLNRRSNARIPPANEITEGVDTKYGRVRGTRKVDFRKGALLPRETVICKQVSVSIEEIPITDDCTGLIDPQSERVTCAGEIQRGQHPFAEQEPVRESVVANELPNHIASIVDLKSFTEICAQYSVRCKGNELPCSNQQCVSGRHDTVCTDNLAMIVDAASCG